MSHAPLKWEGSENPKVGAALRCAALRCAALRCAVLCLARLGCALLCCAPVALLARLVKAMAANCTWCKHPCAASHPHLQLEENEDAKACLTPMGE